MDQNNPNAVPVTLPGQFSFFRAPGMSVRPHSTTDVKGIYNYITTYRPAMRATQELRNIRDDKSARRFKSTHFDFVCFSGVFSYRRDISLESHSGLLCLDFDHVGNAEALSALRQRLLSDRYFTTWLLFISPSGNGLKWVIGIDLNRGDHYTWFRAVQHYISHTYRMEVDEKCGNVSRACFLPYDADCYVNAHPELHFGNFDAQAWADNLIPAYEEEAADKPAEDELDEATLKLLKQVEGITDEIVSCKKDITQGYKNWLALGFALAHGLGKHGLKFYHQLSRLNAGYDRNACEAQYQACLNSKREEKIINIERFFLMAQNAGIDVRKYKESQQQVCAKSATMSLCSNTVFNLNLTKNEDEQENVHKDTLALLAQTTFSDQLRREDIPSFLHPILESQSDAVGRDKMLLGSLNIISGILPETLYSIYDRRKVYAPLYNIIYGRFATSKGELEAVKQLVAPVKEEMRRKYENEMSEYEDVMAEWEAKGKKERGRQPKEPTLRSPFVYANSSAAVVFRDLDANGGWGIMFETEADSLTNMLSKSEYGDYSDLLRKAHHHEGCPYKRVIDHIDIELPNPRLAIFLTCTGSQLPMLLPPGNVANGLASRFLFYELPDGEVTFRNVFEGADRPIEEVFRELGEKLMPLYHALQMREGHPIQFIMSKAQQREFVETFDAVLREQFSMLGDGIQGFIFRLALECYRYAMVLTALRRLSEWDAQDSLFDDDERALLCDDRDFQTAMTIINCLVNHTGRVYAVLGSQDDDPFKKLDEQPSDDVRVFYSNLPYAEMKTADALEVAKQLNFSERTAKRLLGEMVTKYQVLGHPRHGIYVKNHPNKES